MPLSFMKFYIIEKEEKLHFGLPGKPRQAVFKRMPRVLQKSENEF
jgi:hypothetical protein